VDPVIILLDGTNAAYPACLAVIMPDDRVFHIKSNALGDGRFYQVSGLLAVIGMDLVDRGFIRYFLIRSETKEFFELGGRVKYPVDHIDIIGAQPGSIDRHTEAFLGTFDLFTGIHLFSN